MLVHGTSSVSSLGLDELGKELPTLSSTESESSLSTVTTASPNLDGESCAWRMNEATQQGKSSFCFIGNAKLEGWLMKRHAHEKLVGSKWAKRYLFIHEERRLLIISKKPAKDRPFWHKDNTCFPLADCSCNVPDDTGEVGEFSIACNHEKIVLRAADNAERDRWVTGLRGMRGQVA